MSGTPRFLFTNAMYCNFWELYKEVSDQAALNLFTFHPERAVQLICKQRYESSWRIPWT